MTLFFTFFVAEGLLGLFELNSKYVSFLLPERNSISINWLNFDSSDFTDLQRGCQLSIELRVWISGSIGECH
jgi:hypothetical protein